jgi:hypothetical protein
MKSSVFWNTTPCSAVKGNPPEDMSSVVFESKPRPLRPKFYRLFILLYHWTIDNLFSRYNFVNILGTELHKRHFSAAKLLFFMAVHGGRYVI